MIDRPCMSWLLVTGASFGAATNAAPSASSLPALPSDGPAVRFRRNPPHVERMGGLFSVRYKYFYEVIIRDNWHDLRRPCPVSPRKYSRPGRLPARRGDRRRKWRNRRLPELQWPGCESIEPGRRGRGRPGRSRRATRTVSPRHHCSSGNRSGSRSPGSPGSTRGCSRSTRWHLRRPFRCRRRRLATSHRPS